MSGIEEFTLYSMPALGVENTSFLSSNNFSNPLEINHRFNGLMRALSQTNSFLPNFEDASESINLSVTSPFNYTTDNTFKTLHESQQQFNATLLLNQPIDLDPLTGSTKNNPSNIEKPVPPSPLNSTITNTSATKRENHKTFSLLPNIIPIGLDLQASSDSGIGS